MNSPLRLVLVFHNHQPIGNFDGVFEQAYQDSYLPFLDVFEQYDRLQIAIHTSGSLMEWLDVQHPEYVDRLARLTAAGRLEIVGGAYFEPILAMIPSRDRIGQITTYTQWLETRLGAQVRGMWMPERVWEQSMASDLVDAGIGYTILDDFHFKNAGLSQDELHGYYVTEDDARVLNVLPGSEPAALFAAFPVARRNCQLFARRCPQASGSGRCLWRRWREVRHLARDQKACLRRWLAQAVFWRPHCQQRLAQSHDSLRSDSVYPTTG